jgi:hypothetical protein
VDLKEYLNGTDLDARAIEKLKTLPIVDLCNFYIEMEATEDMKRKFQVVIRLLKAVSGDVPVTQVTRPQIIKAVTL